MLRPRPAPRAAIQSPQRGSERNRPSFIIKRSAAPASRATPARSRSRLRFWGRFRKKEGGSSRAPLADCSFSIPGFQLSRAGAHTLENHRETRQLKPNSRESKLRRVTVTKSIAVQPSCCPRDSGWLTGSSAPRKHTRDIDWHCSQSHCNPGRDTHWREGSVGASGTNQHRPIFLKRWKA
jgi:hypothetical protein